MHHVLADRPKSRRDGPKQHSTSPSPPLNCGGSNAAAAGAAQRLSSFLPALASYLHSGAFTDMTVCAEGVEFQCHRLVLAASSKPLADVLLDDEGENACVEGRPTRPVRRRLELPGRSSLAVRAVLRVLYFDATPHQVLSEEPMRTLQILELATEWSLQELEESCNTFAKNNIKDINTLDILISSIPRSLEPTGEELRLMLQERLRALHESAELRKVAVEKAGAARAAEALPLPAGGRRVAQCWPNGSSEHWSVAMQYPKGFGG